MSSMKRLKEELSKGLEATNQLRELMISSRNNESTEATEATFIQQSSAVLESFDHAIGILKKSWSTAHADKAIDLPLHHFELRTKRPYSSKRTKQHEGETIITELTEDGYAWRKYGQKPIVDSKHPRDYYKCGYYEHGCQATKQVQRVSDHSSKYKIVYFGQHTCQHLLDNAFKNDQYDLYESDVPNMLSFSSGKGHKLDHSIIPSSSDSPAAKTDQQANEEVIIKEETPPLPSGQYNSLSTYDLCSVSLDPTVTGTALDAPFSPLWCFPAVATPYSVERDFGHLVASTVECDYELHELKLWEP